MARTSEARKRAEEATSATGWSAVLYLDGEPVTGRVPCLDYEAALIASPLMASWLGGPVSVASAVTAVRAAAASELTLLDHLSDLGATVEVRNG